MSELSDLTPGERALVEKLRSDDTFRLFITRQKNASINGVGGFTSWTVTAAPAPPVDSPSNTGGGHTFDMAWAMCMKPER
ncbi:MAG: hypothetical protein ABIL01_16845 [Pseudomonadota bacterium]